ncbi:MAG TPA: hypothetical protein VFV43_09440 [Limnobacter sp.]|nr:hypothetical protein [Limnobacter sp.]
MKNIALFLISLLLIAQLAIAAPGAHGPNGEHLDAPDTGSTVNDATPRTETFTENFELVAKLYSTELSVLVDDYKTNVPVLNGTLQVQVADLTSQATFHEDAGDYAFDDPALLALLQKPGDHELIFTLSTPTQGDLLLATLKSTGAATEHVEHGHPHHDDHEHDGHGPIREMLHSPYAWLALVLVLSVLVLVVQRIRRRASSTVSRKI